MTRYDEDAYSEDEEYETIYSTSQLHNEFLWHLGEHNDYSAGKVEEFNAYFEEKEERLFIVMYFRRLGLPASDAYEIIRELDKKRFEAAEAKRIADEPFVLLRATNHLRAQHGLPPYATPQDVPDSDDAKYWRKVEQDDINYQFKRLYDLQHFLNSTKPSRAEFIDFRNRNKG